ncbi:MAG TPA: hypothetical protein VMZ51_08065 [Acidimicrobiales bacterium]|nr:hypothetical protein [Acidimicrobiales bacterium]
MPVTTASTSVLCTDPPRNWTLTYDARPWTMNERIHHYERARRTEEWRDAFRMLALEAKVPKLDRIAVVVTTTLRKKVSRDVAAEMPAAKAAIDGLVDAGIIPNDTPAHLVRLTFEAPVLGAEGDSLVLTIEAVA